MIIAATIFTTSAALFFFGTRYERARKQRAQDAFMSRHLRRFYDYGQRDSL